MTDLNVIDQFMNSFVRYIDGGFGLLGGHVRALTSLIVGIDITLAGLFWALGGGDEIVARLLKKVLFVGAFALILNQFSSLADIVFRSFASLGLVAGGNTLTADDLLKPGHLAGTGFSAAWPLLDQASKMMGFASFFDNFLTIIILLIAWIIVIASFFVLAVQLLVTILEFKLTSLAGFVLVPFALWNRTSFLAERVLGGVVTAGIKVMVLAIIVGIGSGYFSQFSDTLQGHDPDVAQAMSLVLASMTVLGLGLFGPGVAAGLVSGAPQLGAGSAIGAAGLAAGGAALGSAAALTGGRLMLSGGLGAVRAGTSLGGAGAQSGVASAAGRLSETQSGSVAAAGREGRATGAGSRPDSTSGTRAGDDAAAASGDAMPGWAKTLHAAQRNRQTRHAMLQTIRDADRGSGGAHPDISEPED